MNAAIPRSISDGNVALTRRPPDSAEMVLRLLGQIAAPGAPSPLNNDASSVPTEVLLDVQLEGFRYLLTRTTLAPAAVMSLSPREREIVRLIGRGLPNKSIAAVLDISLWTVATHIRRVFTKLGVSSRAEMIARVIRDGLLDVSQA